MAEMPRYSDVSNIQPQYARRMVQKYQVHRVLPITVFQGVWWKSFIKVQEWLSIQGATIHRGTG